MSRWAWMSKLTEIRGRLKILDGQSFIIFLVFNVIAFFAGSKTPPNNMANVLNGLIAVVALFFNGFCITHNNKLMEELKEKMPIPYEYLPDKYQEISTINAWIPISLVSVMVFVYLDWAISILVLAVYWVIEWFVSVHKIKKEKNLSMENNRDRLVKIYLQLSDSEKVEDLTQLLKKAREIEGQNDYGSILDLTCAFFWNCLDDKIKVVKAGNEFNSTYEQLYRTTFQYMEDTFGKLEVKSTILPDFIIHMNTFLKELHVMKYLSETVLATIIAFSCFKPEREERVEIIDRINNTLKTDDGFIRNILFLCLEFLYQYNEKKRNTRLKISDKIVALYVHEFKHNRDIRLYYFLWLMWINENQATISDAIIGFYGFIEYCKKNKQFDLIKDEHRIDKTQSLYILINEVKPEQEIRL